MSIKAVIFDLDGTITQPYFDFDAIRQEIGLAKDSGPLLESMEKMTPQVLPAEGDAVKSNPAENPASALE